MRLRCELFGCREDAFSPTCYRCGTYRLDDWIQRGRLARAERWARWAWSWRFAVVGKRCTMCGKRFWRGYDGYCCSDECFSRWLPF